MYSILVVGKVFAKNPSECGRWTEQKRDPFYIFEYFQLSMFSLLAVVLQLREISSRREISINVCIQFSIDAIALFHL